MSLSVRFSINDALSPISKDAEKVEGSSVAKSVVV